MARASLARASDDLGGFGALGHKEENTVLYSDTTTLKLVTVQAGNKHADFTYCHRV